MKDIYYVFYYKSTIKCQVILQTRNFFHLKSYFMSLFFQFIHIRSKNQGVDIRYYVPVKEVSMPPQDIFYWKTDEWSDCSKTCAGGKIVWGFIINFIAKDDDKISHLMVKSERYLCPTLVILTTFWTMNL